MYTMTQEATMSGMTDGALHGSLIGATGTKDGDETNFKRTYAYEGPSLATLLQFAEPRVRGWLRYRYSAYLSAEDMEDIWAEVQIAVLHFKLPEDTCEWQPFLTNFLKQVTWRIYRRYCAQNPRHISLDLIPPDVLPGADEAEMSLDCDLIQCVTDEMLKMPTLHAAALLFHLDADLAEEVLNYGGEALIAHLKQPESILRHYCQNAPLPDVEIARLYAVESRAVIRARQHAREKLRKRMAD